MQRGIDLRERLGEPFRSDEPPQFFVGDLDAAFVLVHLDPKPHDAAWSHHLKASTLDAYALAQRWFGRDHYGSGASPWHSPFDHKQILFVEPFGVIDFAVSGADGRSATRIRLEQVIDEKLQLELIPYASSTASCGGTSSRAAITTFGSKSRTERSCGTGLGSVSSHSPAQTDR